MTIANDFYENLKKISENEPLVANFLKNNLHYHDGLTFDNILNAYEVYVSELSKSDKEKLSTVFWEQIKIFGTPIIEDNLQDDSKCNVYFLFPKDKLSASLEEPNTKKALYLQGDFHGYGSTDGRQELLELPGTGIMWRKDSMPKEALVVYKYIEVEPGRRGIKPEPELPPFFTSDEGFTPRKTNTAIFPEISPSMCSDEYSKHISPYPGFEWGDKIFRVNTNPNLARILGKPIDWPNLLSTEKPSETKNFVYHTTLYSDQAGDLHHSGVKITKQYHDDLNDSNGYKLSLKSVSSFDELDTNTLGKKPYLIKDEETDEYKIWGYKNNTWQLTDIDSSKIPLNWEEKQTVFVTTTDSIFKTLSKGHTPYLPYANFTRDIQIFTPASGKIDDVIVINDGIPYLITGMLDYFDKMDIENTALVFVHALPGLKTTLSKEAGEAYDKDPSTKLPGMGIRMVDYKHGIDQYVDFIANKLFPQLKNEINIPDDPNHRIMIGSSLSGTASIYIASYPNLFGGVIAQSPSPDNREILSKRPKEMLINRNIQLSCGTFEHPDYAGANANVEYARELSNKLKISKPFTSEYGHQFIAWNEELKESLPKVLNAMHNVKVTKNPPLLSQSIFLTSRKISDTAKETEKKLTNYRPDKK